MATTCTITATIVDPSQTGLLGNAFVRFRLRNFQGFVPIVSGTSVLCETQIDAVPSSVGSISQVITCNTAIAPINTFYTVEFWNQGRILSSGNYYLNANASLNTIGTISNTPAPQGPSAIIFENNGNLNSSQTLLNLESTDSSVVITDKGAGTINLQAVASGFGTSGIGGFWSAGFPMASAYGQALSGTTISTTINQVSVFQFTLYAPFTISSVAAYVTANASGATMNFGVYSTAGAKLLDSGSLSAATNNVAVRNTITPVTLPAGIYYFAQSTSNTGVQVTGFTLGSTHWDDMMNAVGTVKNGQAANLTSAGVMPATLGTITADAIYGNMAGAFFAV